MSLYFSINFGNFKRLTLLRSRSSLFGSESEISRRLGEHDSVVLSKETEQWKRFVKQIQVENKKLKDIILKFEQMIRDFIHENNRLKQENQQLILIHSTNVGHPNSSSDVDICYLTLRWLTYEVAQRVSIVSDLNQSDEQKPDTERQVVYLNIDLFNNRTIARSVKETSSTKRTIEKSN